MKDKKKLNFFDSLIAAAARKQGIQISTSQNNEPNSAETDNRGADVESEGGGENSGGASRGSEPGSGDVVGGKAGAIPGNEGEVGSAQPEPPGDGVGGSDAGAVSKGSERGVDRPTSDELTALLDRHLSAHLRGLSQSVESARGVLDRFLKERNADTGLVPSEVFVAVEKAKVDVRKQMRSVSGARLAAIAESVQMGVPESELGDALATALQIMNAAGEVEGEMADAFRNSTEDLPEERRNFSYERGVELSPRGRVSRLTANLNAITLLKKLEEEDRLPSLEEKKVLAAYNGFGADKEVFNESVAAYRIYDPIFRNRYPFYLSWEEEYGRWYDAFKKVMSEEEWRAAELSVLNAHYTGSGIAHAVWDVAERLGVRGGKFLEGSCGPGGLIGAMPPDVAKRAKVTGVELDSLTARIASKLYPQAEIEEAAFQDSIKVGRNQFDFAFTNVPFSDTAPGNQEFPVKLNLHNYCIAKNINALKPGGVAVIITSASTLDGNSEQRAFLAKNTDLVGAIRLPNNAFRGNANTEVVTDILVLRKQDGKVRIGESWQSSIALEVDEEEAHGTNKVACVNEYFHRHPEMVIGKHSLQGKMYGANKEGQYTVKFDGDPSALLSALSECIAKLPSNVVGLVADDPSAEETMVETLEALKSEKVGSFALREGRLYVVDVADGGRSFLVQPPWRGEDAWKMPRGFTPQKADEMATDFVAIREALRGLLATDLNPHADDALSAAMREDLNRAYDGFVLKYGPVNSLAVERLLETDPDLGAVASLESARVVKLPGGQKKVEHAKAAIFRERTVFPPSIPEKADSVVDAVMISLNIQGEIDPKYCARLLGLGDDEEIVKRWILDSGLAFEDPVSGSLEHSAKYLSGNVLRKLVDAQRAAIVDSRFERNVGALEAVVPVPVEFESITVNFGAPWLPSSLLSEFVGHALGSGYVDCHYLKHARRWTLPSKVEWSSSADSMYGTGRVNPREVIEAALSQTTMSVYDGGGRDDVKVYNAKESAKANQCVARLVEEFRSWLKQEDSRKILVSETFNRTFNAVKVSEYSGDHLTFPGLATGAGGFNPRTHQRNVVARMLSEQAGLVAHDVGFGKTLALTLIAMESRRVGLAKKPCIVCDNASYSQFVSTIRRAYPQANILVGTSENVSQKNRDRFISRVATGNWDLVVMAQSHFDRIPNSPDSEIRYINNQLEELRLTLSEVASLKGRTQQQRSISKALERQQQGLIERVKHLKTRGDDCMYWEQMGIDLLLVDEAHKYKKLPFATSHHRIKGVDTTKSQRGERMLIKVQELQAKRGGKGVIFATGTPVTNTLAEAWNMVRASRPQSAEDFEVRTFDEFVAAFTEKVTAMELNEANMRWRNVDRLSKFVNGHAFIQFVRSAFDVQMDSSALALNVPKHKTGDIELKAVELTDATADILDGLSEIYSEYEKSGKKEELSYVPIMLLQVGAAASIDPRLINREAPDDPESVVNQAAREIVSIYEETKEKKSTQLAFLDRYNRMDTSALDKVKKGGMSAYRPVYEDADAAEYGTEQKEEEEAVQHWDLYSDIKRKLVEAGIPAHEVAAVNQAKTDEERREMFDKVNRGELRVVIGSTQKLGTGVNVQQKLYAVHHIDPARDLTPASMRQRNGRVLRDGNENSEVRVIYYGMKDTVTPGIIDRLRRKSGFIGQVFSGKGMGMEFEDAGELNLESMKSALVSDKRQLQRAELIGELRDAKMKEEMAAERMRSLGYRIRIMTERVELVQTKTLKRSEATAKWVEANVTPVDPWAEKDQGRATLKIGSVESVGTVKEIGKALELQIAKWRREPMSGAVKQLGRIEINGLPMSIRKELDSAVSRETKLIVEVNDPCNAGDVIGAASKFGTPDALFKVLRSRYDYAINQPSEVIRVIATMEKDLRALQSQRDEAPKPDRAKVEELEKKLGELEKDMRENPAQRRRKGSAETSAVQSASEPVKTWSADFEPPIRIKVEPGVAIA